MDETESPAEDGEGIEGAEGVFFDPERRDRWVWEEGDIERVIESSESTRPGAVY